jgi:hypothetical protein
MADKHGQSMVGTWTKTTAAACADIYPATLTFSTGTYRSARPQASGEGEEARAKGVGRSPTSW